MLLSDWLLRHFYSKNKTVYFLKKLMINSPNKCLFGEEVWPNETGGANWPQGTPLPNNVMATRT